VADLVHGDKTDDAARWLADHDLLDELRDRISAGGGYHALRELARRLIERDMSQELRELIEAADADTRQVILDAEVGASSAWMNATRVLADFGHKASRRYLARTLAREGRLEELRQRAEHGDEHARRWLDEAVGRLACGSSGRKEGACRGWHRDPDAIAGSDREP
jgi:Spy/CpxP family protein refolding chaperone